MATMTFDQICKLSVDGAFEIFGVPPDYDREIDRVHRGAQLRARFARACAEHPDQAEVALARASVRRVEQQLQWHFRYPGAMDPNALAA
jgi:hypothetical protein